MPESPVSTKLQNSTVELCNSLRSLSFVYRSHISFDQVYNDLPHPPSTYIGNAYAWRTADGSFNNVAIPDMGKAGTHYARSVQQTHGLPKNTLPDPGLVFDTLLKRDGVSHIPCRPIDLTKFDAVSLY